MALLCPPAFCGDTGAAAQPKSTAAAAAVQSAVQTPVATPVKAAVPAAPAAAAVTAVPSAVPPAQPKPQVPQEGLQAPSSAVTGITEAAVRGGVLACARRIEQVSRFLTAGNQSGAYLFTPLRQSDQSLFSASVELQAQNGATIYASASFSPNADGVCGAVYDTVEYSAQPCAELYKKGFQAGRPVDPLRKDIALVSAGATKIFLMPAGSGCVVIKKEVIN